MKTTFFLIILALIGTFFVPMFAALIFGTPFGIFVAAGVIVLSLIKY